VTPYRFCAEEQDVYQQQKQVGKHPCADGEHHRLHGAFIVDFLHGGGGELEDVLEDRFQVGVEEFIDVKEYY
jgi:hypothetical protein